MRKLRCLIGMHIYTLTKRPWDNSMLDYWEPLENCIYCKHGRYAKPGKYES